MRDQLVPANSDVPARKNDFFSGIDHSYDWLGLQSKQSALFDFRLSEMSYEAMSDGTRQLMDKVKILRNPASPTLSPIVQSSVTAEERLFNATATVKMLTAQVAMHLSKEWRDKLFSQIDSLHDLEEWYEDDKPIDHFSFACFLKAILYIRPQRHPGLGLSNEGNLVAAWTISRDRLTIEFLANDHVCWVLTRNVDGETERAAGQTVVSRLYNCLAPYDPKHWFEYE